MTGFLWGLVFAFGVGFAATLVVDEEVRKSVTGLLWALLASPLILLLLAAAFAGRISGRRLPVLRGRPLSPAALRRFTARVNDMGGWVVTWRAGGFLFIHRRTDRRGTA